MGSSRPTHMMRCSTRCTYSIKRKWELSPSHPCSFHPATLAFASSLACKHGTSCCKAARVRCAAWTTKLEFWDCLKLFPVHNCVRRGRAPPRKIIRPPALVMCVLFRLLFHAASVPCKSTHTPCSSSSSSNTAEAKVTCQAEGGTILPRFQFQSIHAPCFADQFRWPTAGV